MLEIAERQIGDVTVLDLRGRMVLEEGEIPFRRWINDLLSRGRVQIVLNLHDVTYIDSAGIGVMVAKYLSVRLRGGDIKLLHLTSRSHRVMTITKLLTVFDVYDEEEAAVRSFWTAYGTPPSQDGLRAPFQNNKKP
jgi:anti-sigma B factor antagonist